MSRDALVVGINSYPFMSNLSKPADDAEAVAKILETYGDFNVRRLPESNIDNKLQVQKDGEVKSKELEQAIIRLFKPEGEGVNIPDTGLLYFAGHGLRKIRGGIAEGYLGTSDTEPEDEYWGLSLQWLQRLLRASPVRQQIIFLDCCHSGELLNFEEADPGYRGEGRDRCFIAASREYEEAYESLGGEHGVFTETLLKGLDPHRHQEDSVSNYILIDFIRQELKGVPQRPIFRNSGNEIIITGKRIESQTPVLEGICPYRGLRYFDFNEEDSKFFYGRTALTDELIDQVNQSNFLAVLGQSGSGKSSVVRAGLLYQLQQGQKLSGSDRWKIYPPFTPGEHPLQELAKVFVDPELDEIDRAGEMTKAEKLIEAGTEGLRRLIDAGKAPRSVITIDQFEEAFTLCRDSVEREQFFACLLGALEQLPEKFCLVLAMRADFLGKCTEQEYSGLAAKIQENLVTVTPMSQEELAEAIREPAKRVGLTLEEGLIRQIVEDAEGPGSLPLLQYTLTELWDKRQVDRLTLSTYESLGGVKGTLQKQANKVYESFTEEQQSITKQIFLELTQLGEGTEDTRRQVFKSDLLEKRSETLPEDIEQTIETLAEKRLIVTNELQERGEGKKVTVVDVAHEALIRNWSKLRGWIEENRDGLKQKREIEADALAWNNNQNGKDYLLQGLKLAKAIDFTKNQTDTVSLSPLAEDFVRRSRQRKRNNLIVLAGLAVAVLSAITGLAGWATVERGKAEAEAQRAQIEADNAEIRADSAASESLFASGKQLEALITSIRGGKRLQDLLEQVGEGDSRVDTQAQMVASLHQAVYGVRESNRLEGHTQAVVDIKFTSDGETIVSASEDGTVKLWNLDGSLLSTLGKPDGLSSSHHGTNITSLDVSGDEQYIAIGYGYRALGFGLISRKDNDRLKGLEHHINSPMSDSGIGNVGFSPDGRLVGSTGGDDKFKLQTTDGSTKFYRDGCSGGFDFSPDGQKIAISCEERNTIDIVSINGKLLKTLPHSPLPWRTTTGLRLRTMLRHSEVNFTPDGKSIATLDGKNTFRLWSLDGTLLTTFIIDHEKIKSISLSPDGKLIASGGEDKAIKIWDRDGNLVSTLVGHNGSITSVKFSPNGKVLASASEDQTIRLWSIDLNRPTIMKGNGAGIKDIDLDDNGNLVVSVSHDKTTKLENLDQTFSKTLSQGEESNHLASTVVNAIISPDNQLIAYSNYDGKVKIRTIEGNFLQDIDINNEGLASSYGFGLDFSPDSNILASSTDPYSSPWTKDLDLPKPQILFWKRRGAKFVLERRDIYSEVYEHITKIMFSPDGKVLGTHGINIGGAAGPLYTADEVIELWQLSDGQLLTRLTGSVINFSSDGKSILTGGSGGRIFVWDKGRNWNQEIDLQMTLTGHEAGITALDFSPDNQLIASASQDGTVRLWLEDGTPVTTLIGHNNSPVNDVQFTPDGKAIVSAGEDGNIVLWNFDLDSLLVRGCYWLEDYLANNPNVKDSDRELCEDIISKVRP